MSATDPDRLTRLEHRVAALETRLNAIAPGGAAAVPPVRATGAGSAAPHRPPSHGWGPPPARPAAPKPLSAALVSAPVPASGPVPASTPSSAEGPAPHLAPALAPAPLPPMAPAVSRSFADLEEQLSSRLLAWVGGIALVLGAMFFLSLAFSRGWIGPEARVLIGL